MQIFERTRRLLQRLRNILGFRSLLLLIIALFLGAVVLVIFPATSAWLENYIYDLRHSIAAGMRAPDPSLLVVGIDMKTLAASKNRWPWPRQHVADSLRLLSSLQPRGIVVDILFQNADTEAGDQQLEQALGELGNVILISILEEKVTPYGFNLARFTSQKRFSEKALSEGFVWGMLDSDGRLRRFRTSEDRLNAKSAALLAFAKFFSASSTSLEQLPTEVPVVFARANGGIPVLSLCDIAGNPEEYSELCRDKVLVLGVNAPAVHDFHNTPLGIVSGVEILASSIDTLVKNRLGNNLVESRTARLLLATAGLVAGWLCVMSGYSLLMTPVIFLVFALFLIVLSEYLLLHLPLAVILIAWLCSSLSFYIAQYFDNLFNLRAMQQEAGTARLVQEQLLPGEALELNNWWVSGLSRSANELGGDYFDYFAVDDRHLLVIIGDATGHGIPSALAMAIGKATVLLGLENGFGAAKLASALNSVLFRALRRKLMMTAALLWVDTVTSEFEYYNCGHPYPYLLKNDGSIEQLAAVGPFLGTRDSYRPGTPYRGSLQSGDRLLFYSDGIIESFPVAKDQDAFELFKNYLVQRPKMPVVQACSDILDNHPHTLSAQPQPDDFTVLLIERANSV